MIDVSDLSAICPDTRVSRLEVLIGPLREAMVEFGISSFAREVAFLAYAGDISKGFTVIREHWGPTPEQTRFDRAEDGEGFRYRGRGFIPVRGRKEYLRTSGALELPLEDHPAMLEDTMNACRAAAWRWRALGFNAIADTGD